MSLLLAGGFILLALLGVPTLIRKRNRRELAVFAVIWLIGAILAFLLVAGRQPPSPLEGVRFLVEHVFSK